MKDLLKNSLYLIPVMIYYLLESLIITLFINLGWKYLIYPTIEIELSFLQIFFIIWSIKIIFFDIFKLISGLKDYQIEENNDNNN